jgi:hypothetical protein
MSNIQKPPLTRTKRQYGHSTGTASPQSGTQVQVSNEVSSVSKIPRTTTSAPAQSVPNPSVVGNINTQQTSNSTSNETSGSDLRTIPVQENQDRFQGTYLVLRRARNERNYGRTYAAHQDSGQFAYWLDDTSVIERRNWFASIDPNEQEYWKPRMDDQFNCVHAGTENPTENENGSGSLAITFKPAKLLVGLDNQPVTTNDAANHYKRLYYKQLKNTQAFLKFLNRQTYTYLQEINEHYAYPNFDLSDH